MLHDEIFDYVLTLYRNTLNGELTLETDNGNETYPLDWNAEAAQQLAQECADLVKAIADMTHQLPENLTDQQQNIWNTYMRPFPEHGMDQEALQEIWQKELIDEALTEKEQQLSDAYNCWYTEIALTRLPQKRCTPTAVINRARRLTRLLELKAPDILQRNEAKCFAQAMVLYHCRKA